MASDVIFEPLHFPNLTVKNRIFRSNISGRFDNYDGTGSQARINWEAKFARGGVGAIISSYSPVDLRGRILPGYASISSDDRIPFWRRVGETVHASDCRFILQLSYAGRQQDAGGVENKGKKALSSTSQIDALHGFPCQAMTVGQIKETVDSFAEGARRARDAGLDGVELHGANGYLITQFLSSAINDRTDEYGGSLENRARFVLEIIRAIRSRVGNDFHLQMKISAADYGDAVFPWEKKGNSLAESIQVCKWIEAAGANALHVSAGNIFPHPLNPPGDFPIEVLADTYAALIPNGAYTLRNFLIFRYPLLRPFFLFLWNRTRGKSIEGLNLSNARTIKQAVSIPVICTGGFQTASVIRKAITEGACDAVSIARSLIANNNLVLQFASGKDRPDRPCTYCNKCLGNVVTNPLGCYDVSRFGGDYDRMIREVMTVFQPTELESSSPNSASSSPASPPVTASQASSTIG